MIQYHCWVLLDDEWILCDLEKGQYYAEEKGCTVFWIKSGNVWIARRKAKEWIQEDN